MVAVSDSPARYRMAETNAKHAFGRRRRRWKCWLVANGSCVTRVRIFTRGRQRYALFETRGSKLAIGKPSMGGCTKTFIAGEKRGVEKPVAGGVVQWRNKRRNITRSAQTRRVTRSSRRTVTSRE